MCKKRLHVASCAAVSLLLLSACAGIPTDGSVNHYADPRSSASHSAPEIDLAGPENNATPDAIIRGFIEAGVGVSNNYAVARQYLTPGYAQKWSPTEQTLVYKDTPSISSSNDSSYLLHADITAQVDARGIANSYNHAQAQELSFKLENVDGQWRISAAPESIILNQHQFDTVYNPFTLYFYDPTFSYAVPDIRWFAERDTVATSLIRVLLEGPAPYLQDAVVSAIPAGTSLTRNAVPISAGIADVDLSGEHITGDLSQLQLERINTQLAQTLATLSTVNTVDLRIAGKTSQTGTLSDKVLPVINPQVPSAVIGVENNALVTRASFNDAASQNEILPPQEFEMKSPAMAISRGVYAYLNEQRNQLWLARNGKTTPILNGTQLTAPSFDYLHWVWVAHSGSQIMVTLSTAETAQPRTVEADWLEAYTVSSLNISRDGTRALITAHDDKFSYVWIAGVIRGSDGAPQRLQMPVRMGTNIAPDFADFSSDQDIVVADYSTGATEIISISGANKSPDILTGLNKISVGSGSDQIIAQTQDSTLYRLTTTGWTRLETSLHDLNFSG